VYKKLPRLFWEPKVYVVGYTSLNEEGFNRFLLEEDVGSFEFSENSYGPERIIEIGGRVCYMSFKNPRPGGNREYIKHIIESGHGSCLEHANFSVIMTGISRSLTHQLARHRAGIAFGQLSQRFVKNGTRGMVVRPMMKPMIEEAIKARKVYDGTSYENLSQVNLEIASCGESLIEHFVKCQEVYKKIQSTLSASGASVKEANENARSSLPECAETIICATFNGRSIRHILELRGSREADGEIRRLACALFNEVRRFAPNLFFDMSTEDGFICSENRKV
jgi:thymidylate synthase (FAD)